MNIEKLKAEIKKFEWEDYDMEENPYYGMDWDGLAKFVAREIIKAKIIQCKEDCLEEWDIHQNGLTEGEDGFVKGAKSAIKHHQDWCGKRIVELQKELEAKQ